MTIFDKTLQFSDAQVITGDAPSTEIVDLGAPGTVHGAAAPLEHNIGVGNPIPILAQVVEAFATLTTLEVQIQASDAETFTPGSAVNTVSMGTFVAADLVAGKKTPFSILPNDLKGRYMRMNYVVTGADATAGKITAGIVADTEQGN